MICLFVYLSVFVSFVVVGCCWLLLVVAGCCCCCSWLLLLLLLLLLVVVVAVVALVGCGLFIYLPVCLFVGSFVRPFVCLFVRLLSLVSYFWLFGVSCFMFV